MATIRDVAKKSGVSVATVSYVLNDGPRPVRAATRERVLEAIRQLDYHPSATARSLVRRRTHSLGVLFPMLPSSLVVTNAYTSALLQGILVASADLGYKVTLYTEPWRDARQSSAAFRDRCTDGLLAISPPTDSDMVATLSRFPLPLVTVSLPADEYGVPSVDVDNVRGGRLAAEHLLALGHRRIAHISGHQNLVSAPLRRAGFVAALHEAGRDIPPRYLVESQYIPEVAYQSACELLSQPEPPTAVFAGNDDIAIATLQAARDLGIRVPERLSVLGFDDFPAASVVTPPLTTLRQPLMEIGCLATRLLVQRVEGKPVLATTHLLEPELVGRGSTAPPAA